MTGSGRRGAFGRAAAVGAVCAVLLVAGATAATGPSADREGGPGTPQDPLAAAVAPVEGFDEVRLRIVVRPNGDARWHVEYQFDLADRNGSEVFDRVARNVTNPPGEFVADMNATAVAVARNRTGRSMGLSQGRAEVDRRPGTGIVRYSFTWENFAATPGENRVVVGDAIAGGEVEPNQTLLVEWPDRLERESVAPAPDTAAERFVRWTGRETFVTDQPTVELVDTGGSGSRSLPVVPVAVAATAVLVAVGGWYGRGRWRGADDDVAATATPDATDGAGDGTATTAADDDTDAATAATDPTPPSDLLSDEERVLRLLEERGGRMKQQDLIDAVEWSRTKVSDTVNEMHEAEQIEVYRLGRENVLALPGEIDV